MMGVYHTWLFELKIWVSPVAIGSIWALCSVYYGFFYGVIGCAWGIMKKRGVSYWALPCIWVCIEWLRAQGPLGNTGGNVGYVCVHFPWMLQVASLGGLWSLTGVVVALNVGVLAIILRRYRWKVEGSLCLILIGILAWGGYRLHHIPPSNQTLEIALFQGNHPQSMKLESENANGIKQDYLRLARHVVSVASPDLLVWPETIVNRLSVSDQQFMTDVRSLVSKKTALLFGTPVRDKGLFYNAAVLVTPEKIEQYRKQRLMPFGEYWPFKKALLWLGLDEVVGEDFTESRTSSPLKTSYFSLGTAICLEGIYPQFSQEMTRKGADFLVNIANNAWFLDSKAASQLFEMNRVRAVECNRYMVQCANTGLSGVITPYGQINRVTQLNRRAIVIQKIKIGLPQSVYVTTGDAVVAGAFVMLIVMWWWMAKPRDIC